MCQRYGRFRCGTLAEAVRPITMQLVGITFNLSVAEALELSNSLVDAVENLRKLETQSGIGD